MFLHRLKYEFAENLKLTIVLWIAFGLGVWSFLSWWVDPAIEPGQGEELIGGLAMLCGNLAAFLLITTMFIRDDLKHPQEFWTTRPIRSFPFFGAKLVYVWLAFILPSAVLLILLGFICGIGSSVLWNGLELILWLALVTHLLALSSMAYPGNRALVGPLSFVGGLIVMLIAVNHLPSPDWLDSHMIIGSQRAWNLLVVLFAVNVWLGWRCWRIIRDKHRTQHPLSFVAAGTACVLAVAFVPFPGGLPGTGIGKPSVTLPKVTQSEFQESSFLFGDRYGARFMSSQIALIPDEKISDADWHLTSTRLEIEGGGSAEQKVEASEHQDTHFDVSASGALMVNHFVFDRKPGSDGSSSTRNQPFMSETVKALPRRKIRIKGTITLVQIHYRELVRGPLDKPFTHRENGILCHFRPAPNLSLRADSHASWKRFSPPLVTSLSGTRRREQIRFRVDSPGTDNLDWTNYLNGGGSSGGSFLGSHSKNDLDLHLENIKSSYQWQQLKENGYDKSVREWMQETQIVCEVIESVTPMILPVDIEVEVPDPDRVQQLLLGKSETWE